jgi:hypothetical protein
MPKGLGRVRWPSLFHTCAPLPPYPRCSQQSKKHFAHQSHFSQFNPKKTNWANITDLELEIEIPGWSENSGQLETKKKWMNFFQQVDRLRQVDVCLYPKAWIDQWTITHTHTHTYTHTHGCFWSCDKPRKNRKVNATSPLLPARVFRFEFFSFGLVILSMSHTHTHTQTLWFPEFSGRFWLQHTKSVDDFCFWVPKKYLKTTKRFEREMIFTTQVSTRATPNWTGIIMKRLGRRSQRDWRGRSSSRPKTILPSLRGGGGGGIQDLPTCLLFFFPTWCVCSVCSCVLFLLGLHHIAVLLLLLPRTKYFFFFFFAWRPLLRTITPSPFFPPLGWSLF